MMFPPIVLCSLHHSPRHSIVDDEGIFDGSRRPEHKRRPNLCETCILV